MISFRKTWITPFFEAWASFINLPCFSSSLTCKTLASLSKTSASCEIRSNLRKSKLSRLSFIKYEGAGNDFILIDDRKLRFPIQDHKLIQTLSSRKYGIGADGLILLQKDPEADFRMRIFNCDGSEAEGCGNGLRCLMQFIADLGFEKRLYRIRVSGRILRADFRDEGIAVDMGEMRNLCLNQKIDDFILHSVDSGVPHAVCFVSDVDQVSLDKMGPYLRYHSHFAPRGSNINVAGHLKDGIVRVRTYERGVEGETLACGTGATAVAYIGTQLFHWPSPIKIRFKGGDLDIHIGSSIWMVGQARRVFDGVIEN